MNIREQKRSDMSAEQRDLFCFSHLRWDFVFQRPQHLLSRFARERRVFYWEEPLFVEGESERLVIRQSAENVILLTPQLSNGLDEYERTRAQRRLLATFMSEHEVTSYDAWFYTPMALEFTSHLSPVVTIYDCMDELSAFAFAPPQLQVLEGQLFQQADLVFTGGASLYEAKRNQHNAVHLFPSSVDRAHFASARNATADPDDQQLLSRPRLGYFGVIDERLDLDLLAGIARLRPDWSIVMIGPVVKVDPASLPCASNIHYLGSRTYATLPSYLAGWDIAMMPFALNESTRYISPTKGPEYLAAGKPVISTPIADVVRPYGELGIVRIADTAEAFVREGDELLELRDRSSWLTQVDALLSEMSWDRTWNAMNGLIARAAERKSLRAASQSVRHEAPESRARL